jgi:hypothetical protein
MKALSHDAPPNTENFTVKRRYLTQREVERSPDDASVREAIEANDTFVQALEAIRDRAHHTLDVVDKGQV